MITAAGSKSSCCHLATRDNIFYVKISTLWACVPARGGNLCLAGSSLFGSRANSRFVGNNEIWQ
eukprot:222159-Karenia_brevis.AAC.1